VLGDDAGEPLRLAVLRGVVVLFILIEDLPGKFFGVSRRHLAESGARVEPA